MKIFIVLSSASASIAIGALPAFAEVSTKVHTLCLDAKDYAGCILFNKNNINEKTQKKSKWEYIKTKYAYSLPAAIFENKEALRSDCEARIKLNPLSANDIGAICFAFRKRSDLYNSPDNLNQALATEIENYLPIKKEKEKHKTLLSDSKSQGFHSKPVLSNQSYVSNNASYSPDDVFGPDDVEIRQGFTYRKSSVRQQKIRGAYGRYLTFWGRSENEYQGTSASYNAGNPGTLNCYSSNSGTGYMNNNTYSSNINYNSSGSTNCQRSGYVSPSYTPGTPGGTQKGWFEYDLDCVDRTFNRKGDKAKGIMKKGWLDVYYDPTARAVADKYCQTIDSLPKKY